MVIKPGRLKGRVQVPPSKSAAHRAAICAALANGKSTLTHIDQTNDMLATAACMKALGAECVFGEDSLTVTGIGSPAGQADLHCGESGSTLRFVIPIAAALGVTATFYGEGQLPHRPNGPLLDQLAAHGVRSYEAGQGMFTISGQLAPGLYQLPGDVSSQYVTGLLFALPLLEGDSQIEITSPLQSKGYVDMTVQTMEQFGVLVETEASGYRIPGKQRYQPHSLAVESDYSGAAFWLCAGAVHSEIEATGLSPDSLQGDKAILQVLKEMGTEITQHQDAVLVKPGSLKGMELDVSQIPDLVPALAAAAVYGEGTTTFTNAARLRIKECDRLRALAQNLAILGADVEERADSLIVHGGRPLKGGTVDSFGDHRIAMALTIAALGCQGETTILGAECVAKSYPGFYRDFQELGGICCGV